MLRVSQSSSCVVASIVIAEVAVLGDLTSDVVNCVGFVCVVVFIFVGFGVIVDSPNTRWSGVIVVIVVAVVALSVVTVSFVVVNIEVVGLFVCVVLTDVVDAVCGAVCVVRLIVLSVVTGLLGFPVVGCRFVVAVCVVRLIVVSVVTGLLGFPVVGCRFVVAVYLVGFSDITYLLVVILFIVFVVTSVIVVVVGVVVVVVVVVFVVIVAGVVVFIVFFVGEFWVVRLAIVVSQATWNA